MPECCDCGEQIEPGQTYYHFASLGIDICEDCLEDHRMICEDEEE